MKNRVVLLNKRAVLDLSDYLDERRRHIKYINEFLFVSSNQDSKFTEHGLKHLIERIKTATDIHFHAHQLRHTWATEARSAGLGIDEVSDALGHSSIETTKRIYVHTGFGPTRLLETVGRLA